MALIGTPLPNKNVAPPGLKEESVNRHSVSCNSDISCLNLFPNCTRLRGQILFELLCPTRNFSSHAIAPGCTSETNCDAPNCRLFLGASILIAAWLCPKEREFWKRNVPPSQLKEFTWSQEAEQANLNQHSKGPPRGCFCRRRAQGVGPRQPKQATPD